uniref:Non-structural maintenance of chromosomes element 4 n=1 Tax=Rhodosorus marinus TaxID=101924 RepID=A0A7S3A943_9RHOD|mmetsp:Transcript_785/g.1933  ORF Transcript_785/g.1933 Transcript_785/m.1933 type:complete len:278 (+) Transcript_785:83-916(+)
MDAESQLEKELKDKRTTVALREHLESVKGSRDEVADPSKRRLDHFFDENDHLHDKSNLIVHQNLVAQSFLELSQAAKIQSRRLQTSLKNFSGALFIEQLNKRGTTAGVNQIEEEEAIPSNTVFDFESLGAEVSKYYRIAPSIDFMYGLQELRRKERQFKRTIRHKERSGKLSKPEEVTQGDSGEKTVADKRIETMDSTLRKEKNVSLYDIAVDQGSFSKSVENLFYFSFLVKDGRARVAADKIGYQATSIDPAERARQSTGEESRQVILRCETIPLR